jgi:hypothetical protein
MSHEPGRDKLLLYAQENRITAPFDYRATRLTGATERVGFRPRRLTAAHRRLADARLQRSHMVTTMRSHLVVIPDSYQRLAGSPRQRRR